ncbi:MAG: DUF4304 domain-containing protein [Arenimonas sp.]
MDGIQRALKPSLVGHGFRARGRTFNRVTADGLTQVVNLQMGSSDPPGTTYIPGLRENFHGLFTINLGVYVPEDSELRRGLAKAWVQVHDCCIRSRLGQTSGSPQDIWWQARNETTVVADVQSMLLSFGLLFLDRFASRDQILSELEGCGANEEHCNVPRIVSAIILCRRGETDAARALMAAQTHETLNRNHPAYVRELALRMGLGEI